MKRVLLAVFVLTLSSLCFSQEKIVIIDDGVGESDPVIEMPRTRSFVSLDYLQVINNELYICSDNNVDGTCYYNVYKDGNVVMEGTILLAYGKNLIAVKSLPKGDYVIEVETPSRLISKRMVILEKYIIYNNL